jgi:hypothetical protein
MNGPKKTAQEILSENKDVIEKGFIKVLEENGIDPEEAQNLCSPSIGGCGLCFC